MTKILITGGGGYIGSVAADLFLKNNYEVVVIDNFCTGFRQALEFLVKRYGNNKLKYYKIDLHDNLDNFFEKEKNIEAVIHYAASCVVDESMKKPEKYFYNNVCGSQNLLASLIKNNIKKIVFSSTCAVYGEASYIPIDEKHLINPNNPYGESKAMIENMIKWFGSLSDMRFVILRYFNVCGASDDGAMGYSKKPATHLIENAVRGALEIAPFFFTYQKVKTKDGSPIRDYVNVVDLNMAHLKAVEYLLNGGKSEIINLGTGTGNSVLEIVEKIQHITGKKIEIKKAPSRQGEAPILIATTKRAKEILKWEPQRKIEDAIKSLVVWYKNHPYGWDY